MLVFKTKTFDELSLQELYAILALRAEVFVVEQNCPYQDVDGKDEKGLHLLGMEKNQLLAYARILPKGVSYDEYTSIGRIVTAPQVRAKGYGHTLVEEAVKVTQTTYPTYTIKISAQAHLEQFYRSHEFVPTGEAYLEDDIPHIGMLLKD